MQELTLSIMATSLDPAEEIRPVLAEFEAEQHIHVNLQVISWETAWVELVKMALYRHGPDVSEVGSTWTVNLTSMDALRPFTKAESDSFGGAAAFVPTLWNSEVPASSQQRWGIPWNVHTDVICYRRDLLARAGLDAARAFDTSDHMAMTLTHLQQNGYDLPLIMPTTDQSIRDNLHLMASWVWGHGGDFISPDGKRTLFQQAEARAGIKAYFNLYRYLPPRVHNLDINAACAEFTRGRAVSVILPAILLYRLFRLQPKNLAPEVQANFGTAVLPGTPFVGGSNLVIWKHAPSGKTPAILKLIHFLTGRRAQVLFGQRSGIPPARLNALDDPFFAAEPFQSVAKSLQTGRSYRSLERWGIVEEKLVAALSQIRSEVLAHPNDDLDTIISRQLDPVAQNLDLILGS